MTKQNSNRLAPASMLDSSFCLPTFPCGALVDERGNVIGIVSAKLDAGAALAASGALPENVNYAVKSSLLLSFLESVPAVSAKLAVAFPQVGPFLCRQ